MNTKLITANVLALSAIAAVLLHGQGAGTLDPPAAPADGVYKTLEQVYLRAEAAETHAAAATLRAEAAELEAAAAKSNAHSAFAAASASYQNTQLLLPLAESRIPIGNLPFTISTPGSYYFRSDKHFTASTGNAITIAASCVTLDLNGFALTSSSGVTGDAVRFSSGANNVTVRNGHIRGNSSPELPAGFENGIGTINGTSDVIGWQFSDLSVSGCRGNGIGTGSDTNPFIDTPFRYGTVSRCTVSGNHGDGLRVAHSSVSSCVAYLNGRDGMSGGNVYQLCSSGSNNSSGIESTQDGVVQNCMATHNSELGFGAAVVIGSTARYNLRTGISSWVASESFAAQNDSDIAGGGSRTGNYPAP